MHSVFLLISFIFKERNNNINNLLLFLSVHSLPETGTGKPTCPAPSRSQRAAGSSWCSVPTASACSPLTRSTSYTSPRASAIRSPYYTKSLLMHAVLDRSKELGRTLNIIIITIISKCRLVWTEPVDLCSTIQS